MSLGGKQLDAVTSGDLQALIDDAVSESREIEFKESVGTNDDAKREFLADVSSFANASGGDLLVGIRAKNGVAADFSGSAPVDADREILRLENIIRDGLDPRIPGIQTRAIPTPEGNAVVLVIRVPRSFAAPHMITFRNLSRFFSRHSAGKYQLDVSELRAAFSFADSVRTSLRNFRLERLARIAAGDAPIALPPDPKIVLHLIPLTAIDPSVHVNAVSLVQQFVQEFRPIYTDISSHRINFDGALAFSPNANSANCYTQVFRNGAIEAVEAYLLGAAQKERDGLIPNQDFEKALIEALDLYLKLLRMLVLSPPYLLALSLLGVKGMRMGVNKDRYLEERHRIDRDDLLVPEIMVEDDTIAPATIIRPAIDAVWNATGWPGSTNYDSGGVWHGR